MAEAKRPGLARRRLMAWVAIGSAALLGVAVAVLLVRHALALILCLVGLGLAVAGGWWVLTERMLRRAIGMVGLVAGVVVMLVALVRVATGGQILLRVAILVVLMGITGWAARAATAPEHPASAAAEVAQPVPQVRWRPQRAVLICNPWSGGGKVERFGLLEYAAELGVETVLLDHGLDLEQLARDAIARGADCLGMAGGDGSQALVASIAIEHDLPFVCVSAGTRNHFAMDLCLDREDPRKSMLAFRDAIERRVDYARVGGRLFVNNVSLGIYATIVQQDSYRDAKIETSKEILPDLLGLQA
ncbi:MAG TPA: diacylglycerol kinase family protein, partial [Dermatophilaceae bacterium]